ncbi:conserved hypothetical protein [Hyella patelloides LEGE 07179]|uniref:DUF4864 domain-containing protein n=1 Tax=Hyella patelloides LEGE 07179 TaxID=945734 RepID=A0A563VTI1_9CYAN|nr:DUF4864 domain-containing protein [Hyella patelloides]VEP14723.1 conserved hypothetical protein [Hyella patelloides LEGE 07179]
MYISELDKAEIRQVIEKQLQAFQQDDFITAFSFASPAIQQQFGSWDNFKDMVTDSYQAVYRPRSVMFRGFTMVENFPAQNLILMDSTGNIVQATYVMQLQQDHSWRIHGCFLVPIDKTVS